MWALLPFAAALALALWAGVERPGPGFVPVSLGVRGALESEIARRWCEAVEGELEVRTGAGTRVDCLTHSHAFEVERAAKWAEAIGQALHYGAETGRAPGIVLMLDEGAASCRFLGRLEATIEAHDLPIRVWSLGPESGFRYCR